ncbi:MAG: hypothetical protein II707_08685, partial [Spirochaetales bacterium]|nr:hypothetical protein [Spirochaetales bacterium]
MNIYKYISFATLFNFSLNREFRKYIKNPNDPAAKARLAYMLSGKNMSNTDFTKVEAVRHNSKDGTIDHIKSSDEMMNDMVFRLDQIKTLANNHAAKVNKDTNTIPKFDPNTVNVINQAKYIDQYGNLVNVRLNRPKSNTNISATPIQMDLSNPMHKYHEGDGHCNPNLRNYVLQNPSLRQLINQNGSHSTPKLQQIEACADLYGIEAYNQWCRLKKMPSSFDLTADKMIQDRNKILYQQKDKQQTKLEENKNNPQEYQKIQKEI